MNKKKDFHFLFTFHGLPVRQIKKADPSGNYCLQAANCCRTISSQNQYCYRAHCLATANLLARKLKLGAKQWSFSFQSRLGRSLWLTPYTGDILQELAKRKIEKVVLVSPSFVADGLETLQELGKHEHDDFIKNGGKQCILIPCLNSHPLWVDAIIDMIK